MRHFAASLLASAAVCNLAIATDTASTWLAWTPAAPITVTSVQSIYKTDTSYITVTGPTTTVTGPTTTETDYKTTTQINTVTATLPPVTITQFNTVTLFNTVTATAVSVSNSVATVQQTVEETETIQNTIATTATATVVNTATVPTTATATVVNTVLNTATVVNTLTITSISAVTVSVSATCVTPASGIVTCPSRIINPTYTPPTPLPSDYLWGCPPGKLCHPRRECCNFEQNLPADTYVCAPEECLPVAQLPPLRTFEEDEATINDTCAFITPNDDYFNIDPLFFGLNFGIFNIYGQPTCTPSSSSSCPTATVVEVNTVSVPTTIVQLNTVSVPTTIVQVNTVPTTIIQVTTAPVPTTVVEVTTVTAAYIQSSASSPATWNNWQSSATGPAPSKVTKRAELEQRQIAAPPQCYEVCNQAAQVWQSIGMATSGCSSFNSAFALVTSCTKKYAGIPPQSIETQLNTPIVRCRPPTKRSTAEELQALKQGSVPAFRFARG